MPAWISKRSGFELAILANLLWGTSFLASKQALAAWGPYTTSVLRLGLALATLWVLGPRFGCRVSLPRGRAEWAAVTAVGLFSFGALYPLQFAGLRYIPSAISAAIMLLAPLVLLALNQAFSSEQACPRRYAAVGMGIVGGLLLLFPGRSFAGAGALSGPHTLVGVALTLGAAISLALSIMAIRLVPPSLGSSNLAFWSIAVSFAALVPFSVSEGAVSRVSWSVWLSSGLSLAYLAVICTALCTLLWQRAIVLCSERNLAPTMHLKTPVAVLLGPLIAGETLSTTGMIGIATILVAVWVVQPRAELAARPG